MCVFAHTALKTVGNEIVTGLLVVFVLCYWNLNANANDNATTLGKFNHEPSHAMPHMWILRT